MTPELQKKLKKRNQIIKYFQRGLLSEDEFNRLMIAQDEADKIERESRNADLMQDEMEEISLEEVEDVYYAERAKRDAEKVLEDGLL